MATSTQPRPPRQVFYLADLRSGAIMGELPLVSGGTLRRLLGQTQQQSFSFSPYDESVPPDWNTLVNPGRTMIVQTLDGEPSQAWVLIDAEVGDTTVPLNASTLEECLARTYVPDVTGEMDESTAAYLVAQPLITNFGFTIDYTLTGKTTEADYSVDEDRKILDALTTIMADGGPEFRVTVGWAEDRRGFTKTLQIAGTVGSLRPDVVFDLDAAGRGSIDTYRRKTSYADGDGATELTGATDGSGSARVLTDPQTASAYIDAGWARWQERRTFPISPDVVDIDAELLNKTRTLLASRAGGTVTWTVVGNAGAPQPGRDFQEGDTVTIAVAPQGKRDPEGGTAQVRVLGWDYDPESLRVTPILWEDREDGT